MKLNILDAGQNKIEVEFHDISQELYRTYAFPGGETVTIEEPTFIYVSKSGGHRIIDKKGISHYIPCGWKHLQFKVKDGEPYFVR